VPLVPTGSSLKDTIKDINMRERMQGATSPMLTMNSPITVNGVPTGREGAVGREVARALQDPTRMLLAQLKEARAAEQRLGYT
jgi:hypothetical protein